MAITDELREWIGTIPWLDDSVSSAHKNVLAIADRIDAAHRAALEKLAAQVDESERIGFDQGFASADDWLAQNEDAMADHGWVRLPVDEDGVTIRIGDRLTDGEYTFTVCELATFRDGSWSIRNEDGNAWAACDVTHHALTVEDVLDEFFGKANLPDGTQTRAEIVAEYAAKLRLAEGVDE